MTNKFTTEEFIRRAREIHRDKYDYSKVEYKTTKIKVCIVCPKHGEFWQTPHQHLLGSGCPRCKYNRGYKLNYEPIEGEIWMPIKDFEEFYKISNKGRLMSSFSGEWSILSNVNSKGWYFTVVLRKGEIKKTKRIHRLVYETFVGDIPKGKKYHIHHINHDKQDNRVENLLLVSAKEHYQLDIDSKNISGLRPIWENYEGGHPAKKVVQKSLDGEIIAFYDSAKQAHLATGVCERNIRQVASKEPYNKKGSIRKQAGGFIWEDVVE